MVNTADDKQATTLFAKTRIAEYLAPKQQQYESDLAKWDPDDLLARTPEDIAAELLKRHGVTSLEIGDDPGAVPDSVERTVNLGREFSFSDTRRKVRVYRFTVPFTGDANLFTVQPTSHTLNPPAGHVDARGSKLTVEYEWPWQEVPDPEKIGQAFEEQLRKVSWYLDQLRTGVDQHNAQIQVLYPIQQRIAAITADRDVLARIPRPKL